MGLRSKIIGINRTRRPSDYVELTATGLEPSGDGIDYQVSIASIDDKSDAIEIREAVYAGDIVVADITRHTAQDRTMEHITNILQKAAQEVGGDIVQKDDDQFIITPAGVVVDRKRLA